MCRSAQQAKAAAAGVPAAAQKCKEGLTGQMLKWKNCLSIIRGMEGSVVCPMKMSGQ